MQTMERWESILGTSKLLKYGSVMSFNYVCVLLPIHQKIANHLLRKVSGDAKSTSILGNLIRDDRNLFNGSHEIKPPI